MKIDFLPPVTLRVEVEAGAVIFHRWVRTAAGREYRATSLAEPGVFHVRVDPAGLLALAVRSITNKGGRASDGPLVARPAETLKLTEHVLKTLPNERPEDGDGVAERARAFRAAHPLTEGGK